MTIREYRKGTEVRTTTPPMRQYLLGLVHVLVGRRYVHSPEGVYSLSPPAPGPFLIYVVRLTLKTTLTNQRRGLYSIYYFVSTSEINVL
jgi:hypothetical protein